MPTLYWWMLVLPNVGEIMTEEENKIIDELKKKYGVETDLELFNRLISERVESLKGKFSEEKNHPQEKIVGDKNIVFFKK